MVTTVDALILDMLDWIGPNPRPYLEVIEACACLAHAFLCGKRPMNGASSSVVMRKIAVPVFALRLLGRSFSTRIADADPHEAIGRPELTRRPDEHLGKSPDDSRGPVLPDDSLFGIADEEEGIGPMSGGDHVIAGLDDLQPLGGQCQVRPLQALDRLVRGHAVPGDSASGLIVAGCWTAWAGPAGAASERRSSPAGLSWAIATQTVCISIKVKARARNRR